MPAFADVYMESSLPVAKTTPMEGWLRLKRGEPANDDHFYYLDAVEEALCFG